ncbi:MAG: GNAT family N-acetyltransferase [Ruminococcaceae bacterium]|nr:GNAT family N-acetyltransferase [Oscillospiraceae bacterium]
MTYTYIDYMPDFETIIDSWLDEDAAYYTGFEDGFAVYYNYWAKDPNTVLGENFWMKIILENSVPIGVVVLSLADDTVDFLELLIDPTKRGQGIGTAVIGDVLKNSKDILGRVIDRAEACIYPSNVPSQKAFEKAGFQFDHTHPDGDIWYYTYKAK